MKDYLAGTTYTQVEKDLLMKLARHLYTRYDIGRKSNIGWNVCDDDDRNSAVGTSINIYLDVIRPYVRQVVRDTQEKVLETIIEKLKIGKND